MEEKTQSAYRVRVNLSRFFDDERSLCYISVQGDRRVRWLLRRLRRLFALPRRVCLLSCGHLLPPDEPLSLLQPDDPVDVIPLSVGCNWTLNEKSTKSTTNKLPDQGVGHEENDGKILMMPESDEDNESTVNIDSREKNKDSCVSEYGKRNIDSDFCYSTDNVDGLEMYKEDENLKQIKERALALLETFQEQSTENLMLETSQEQCNEKSKRNIHISPNQDRPHRIRRRVRRRRPRNVPGSSMTTDPGDMISHTEQVLQENDDKIIEKCEFQSSISNIVVSNTTTSPLMPQPLTLFPDHVAATVIQNSKVAPRAARLIRPIDEETCIEPTIAY